VYLKYHNFVQFENEQSKLLNPYAIDMINQFDFVFNDKFKLFVHRMMSLAFSHILVFRANEFLDQKFCAP
jgi:hypothetical protein